MKITQKSYFLLLFTGFIAVLGTQETLLAQERDPGLYDYSHNHLPWFTIESDHFSVHFQEGNSRPAQVISRIAEEVYPAVTELYQYEPDSKISIVLNDRLDYSNGAAFFFDNKIEIWLPALDSPLRGTHDWLRNVITHEFVHIIQIQASLKYSRKRPVSYLQWLSYEDVRRPDVLYGFPSGIITYPFSAVSIPAWLAEGTAQYQRSFINYDYWDSHRDMILRTRILDDSYLRLNVMGTFASKTSIEREVTYNQGFAFTTFLAQTYGEDVLRRISEAFSRRGVYDVRKAIEMATGTDGNIVFDNWITSLKSHYDQELSGRTFTESTIVEPDGFFNFYPVHVPATGEILYLSNRGRDEARVSLYSTSATAPSPQALLDHTHILSDPHSPDFTLSCGHAHKPEIQFIQSAFSVSADGQTIAYNRIRETRFGEPYNDLYLYNRTTRKSTRISAGARLTEPALSPDGSQLVAGMLRDGTMNLVLIDLDEVSEQNPITGPDHPAVRRLTGATGGEQMYRPVWSPDGASIYVAFANSHRRQIRRIDLENPTPTTLLNSDTADYRDPFVSSDGRYLYYSTDHDGIFNIWRMHLEDGSTRQLTSVRGGAFMPTVDADNTLIYAEYIAEGYKIAKLPESGWLPASTAPLSAYARPYHAQRHQTDTNERSEFVSTDDRDIRPLPDSLFTGRRMPETPFSLPTQGGSSERTVGAYTETFTSFSIYPTIRFDNYSKINGSNAELLTNGDFHDLGQNLWRDVKTGIYFASREMIDRFSLFGGAMIGLGSLPADGVSEFVQPSRLVDLDRDLFLIAEYRGLPFIKRSWSPTVSVELFNIRRNVENGLSIEEFPCTPCLPDTTSVGIAYDVWEAQINLISKVNRFTTLEVGWHHSPYRVSTNAFFSREFRQTVSGSSSRYFIGNTITAASSVKVLTPHRHSDISIIGFESYFRYRYQPSRLLEGYDIRGGTLIPVYNTYKQHSVELDMRQGFRALDQHLFDVRTRLFTNFSGSEEYFFLDYIGGLPGLRSYSYFALGGNTTFLAQLNYHQPIFEKIHRQQGRFTVDKIFTRFFLESGNGWGGPLGVGNNLKTGLGAELRFSLSSYYLFPTRFFISGAYGLNQFDVNLPESFITTTGQNSVTYGREVLFNFGLLFDFDF